MYSLTVAQLNISIPPETFQPHTPGIWKASLYLSTAVKKACFWFTLWSVEYDSLFDQPVTIASLIVDLVPQNEVGSLAGLDTQDSSFYWDNDDQILYARFADSNPPYAFDIIDTGESFNFVSQAQLDDNGRPTDTILDDRYYEPRLLPGINDEQTLDDLGRNKMTFDSFSFSIPNHDGAYDNLRQQVIGQFSSILHKEQETKIVFSDLETIRFGVVDDVTYLDGNTVNINVSDPRSAWKAKANNEILTQTLWPNLNDSDVDKRIPLAVGPCLNVPAIQVGTTMFLFSTTSYGAVSADTVYVDDVSTSFVDNGEGTVTISGYTNGKVTIDVTGINKGNIAEMILWFIEEFAGLTYTANNYNLTEVQAIVDVAQDGGYYCGTSGETLKDIIDFLSGSINTYIFTQGSVFTMRNLTVETEVAEIYTDQLLVAPAGWSFDGDRYASSQRIRYKKDWTNDEYFELFDESKELTAFENNAQDAPAEFDSALLSLTDAQAILTQRYELSILAQKTIGITLGTAQELNLADYVAFTHERPGKGEIAIRSKYRVVAISKLNKTASLLFVEELGPKVYDIVFDFTDIGQTNIFDFNEDSQTQFFDFTPEVPQEVAI